MDPGKILCPEPVKAIETSLADLCREASVVHPRKTVARLDEQPRQCGIVHLGQHVVVEQRLSLAIEDLVGHDTAQHRAKQTLEAEIRNLRLSGKAEEKFP